MKTNSSDETRDTILGGRLTLIQPKHGYRFSIEAILLGRFARAGTHDRVLELGAGCGVVSIIIAALARPREVVAIELQTHLAGLIARNAALNDLTSVRVVCADIKSRKIEDLEPASFDLVVANPPYRAIAAGRENPEHGRRVARGESTAAIADFVATARRYGRRGARVAFIFTARRAAELVAAMRAKKLEPKRIRFVHPTLDSAASVVMIEARVDGGVELAVEPPLILYDAPGLYTEQALAMLK